MMDRDFKANEVPTSAPLCDAVERDRVVRRFSVSRTFAPMSSEKSLVMCFNVVPHPVVGYDVVADWLSRAIHENPTVDTRRLITSTLDSLGRYLPRT